MKKKLGWISVILVTILIIGIYLFLCLGYFLYPIKYKDSIYQYATEFNVKKEVIASVINAESKFDEDAISYRGAIGLMQIMPKTAQWLAEKLNIEYSEELLFEPDYNIKLGTYYVSYLQDKFSNLQVVLCAYNAGEGVVKEWLNNEEYSNNGETLDYIPYEETRNYVKKVMSNIKIYSKKLKN